jgi:hypothetical protein
LWGPRLGRRVRCNGRARSARLNSSGVVPFARVTVDRFGSGGSDAAS